MKKHLKMYMPASWELKTYSIQSQIPNDWEVIHGKTHFLQGGNMGNNNRQLRKYLSGFVALSVILCAIAAYGATTERQTIYGKIQGIEDVANTWAWLGVPYAKPPVAGLRWKAPANPDPWGGVKLTTSFCEKCPQYKTNGDFTGNED